MTASDDVRENVRALSETAVLLYRRRKFAASAHIAIAANEEAAKALIVFCREHLPQRIFNARFKHIQKHRLGGAPYFLAGAMSTIFVIEVARREGFLGGTPDEQSLAMNYLMELAGHRSPERAAYSMLAMFEQDEDEEVELDRKAGAQRQEKDRVESVYVDIDHKGAVVSAPTRFQKADARKYVEQAIVGLRVLDMVNAEDVTVDKFVASLPRSLRSHSYAQSKEMVEYVLSKRED